MPNFSAFPTLSLDPYYLLKILAPSQMLSENLIAKFYDTASLKIFYLIFSELTYDITLVSGAPQFL